MASMDLKESIKEGIRSIKGHLLRTVLTAMIVAIGIMALVCILTAIDGMKASINDSFSSLGAASFEVRDYSNRGRRNRGKSEKLYPQIEFDQVNMFKKRYEYPADMYVLAYLTGSAEIKRGSEKTNPNVSIAGSDEYYLGIEGIDLEKGRNFSPIEVQNGVSVAIIGTEVETKLFKADEDPIGKEISAYGNKFRVIGVLEKKGRMSGGSTDRSIYVPLQVANRLSTRGALRYRMKVGVENPLEIDAAMGEATGIMRIVRRDSPGAPNSFEIKRNETVAEELDNIAGYMQMGGFGIGFITLLGASIALMNIMMVSVTERTKEIGIRKALGATPKLIKQQFLIEAIIICVLGGIAGVVLGVALGNVFASIIVDGGSFVFPWVWTIVGLLVCVAVGLLSGYIPANKASKFDPVDALRFE